MEAQEGSNAHSDRGAAANDGKRGKMQRGGRNRQQHGEHEEPYCNAW